MWTKIKLYDNFDKILKNLIKFKIFWIHIENSKNFDRNRDVQKLWLGLRFSENFLPKSRFFEIIYKNQDSSTLLNEIKIVEKFDRYWDYLKILTNFEICIFVLPKSR